jgi:hypothetical protein
VEAPKVEKLQRVSLGHVALLAFTIFAVYGVISQLADVGFSTIVDALSNATWGLVIVALILVQLTNFTDAVSLAAASPKPIPVGITTVEQTALGFVNLAVPSAAGRLAVNVRFFQRFGISAVTSSTSATIASVLGFVSQVLLLVLTIIVGKRSIDLSKLQTGGGVPSLLLFAVAIVAVGVVLVLVVPAWRHWVEAKLRAPLRQMGSAVEVLKDPKKLLITMGGQIGTEILYGSGLMLCVLALGGSINLGQALFITITVALFAGLTARAGRHRRHRGRAHRRPHCRRRQQRRSSLRGHRVPAVQLLPPALVGLGEPALADSPRLPLTPHGECATSRSPARLSPGPARSSLMHER